MVGNEKVENEYIGLDIGGMQGEHWVNSTCILSSCVTFAYNA